MSEQLLIIGNGFDLDCNLPTRYSDFYQFTQAVQHLNGKSDREAEIYLLKNYPFSQWIDRLLKEYKDWHKGKSSENDRTPFRTIYDLTQNNFWIDKQKYDVNKRWIDFEADVAEVIQELEEVREYADEFGLMKKFPMSSMAYFDKATPLGAKYFDKARVITGETHVKPQERVLFSKKYFFFDGITFEKIEKNLYKDLQRLTVAFEVYLSDYVLPLIKEYSIDLNKLFRERIFPNSEKCRVLCFNYTNTVEQIIHACNEKYKKSIEYEVCYLHGKARDGETMKRALEENYYGLGGEQGFHMLQRDNQMVLGMNDYSGSSDTCADFSEFKKFYQRILKYTDSKYQDWADSIQGKAADIYIYGHSLGVTDTDILHQFLTFPGTKIYIYYCDDNAFASQVNNLIEILGKETLVKFTRRADPKITFVRQEQGGHGPFFSFS